MSQNLIANSAAMVHRALPRPGLQLWQAQAASDSKVESLRRLAHIRRKKKRAQPAKSCFNVMPVDCEALAAAASPIPRHSQLKMLSNHGSEGSSLMSSRCNVWNLRTIVHMLTDKSFLARLYLLQCHVIASLPKRCGMTVWRDVSQSTR